ncbi:MAG: hypothetical protein HUJ53_02175, partial [Holdemanella sp.]|nr:hypothetical protein [Holdemanella sp.]
SEWERLQAEEKMSSALDMLRKGRGQKTITEEEAEFDRKQAKNMVIMDDGDDDDDEVFTSANIESVEKRILNVNPDIIKKEAKEDKKEDKPKKDSPKKKPKKSDKKKVTPLRIFIVLVILGFVLMGGYAYKVFIYDPANVASEEQITIYNKLISYADEYDMMSESEKLELLDMEADYNTLLEKQKKEIDEYFKDENHVGKSFSQTIKDLKKLKESMEDESSEDFQKLKTYLEGWNTYTEIQKREIVNYKSSYDKLNSILQKKIDDISRKNGNKSFNALYQEYQTLINKEQEAQKKANEEELARLQLELAEAKNLLNSYQTYAAYLEETGGSAEEISQNKAAIAECEQNIANLEARIAMLE